MWWYVNYSFFYCTPSFNVYQTILAYIEMNRGSGVIERVLGEVCMWTQGWEGENDIIFVKLVACATILLLYEKSTFSLWEKTFPYEATTFTILCVEYCLLTLYIYFPFTPVWSLKAHVIEIAFFFNQTNVVIFIIILKEV